MVQIDGLRRDIMQYQIQKFMLTLAPNLLSIMWGHHNIWQLYWPAEETISTDGSVAVGEKL